MSPVLIDTNILLRVVQQSHTHHMEARVALRTLRRTDSALLIAEQNLVEAWNVMTRPEAQNGFGWTPQEASKVIGILEGSFGLLSSPPEVHEEWKRIVAHFSVSGAKVHDARLVALMKAHGIGHILTFNTSDFRRYESEGVVVLDPQDF